MDTTERQCKQCGVTKPLTEFKKREQWRSRRCRDCFNNDPHTKESRHKYKHGKAGLTAQKREHKSAAYKERMKRWYSKHAGSDEIKARWTIGNAIRSGKLPPAKSQTCRCGKTAQHYHHHLGYAKEHRLHVIPLCAACHKAEEKD